MARLVRDGLLRVLTRELDLSYYGIVLGLLLGLAPGSAARLEPVPTTSARPVATVDDSPSVELEVRIGAGDCRRRYRPRFDLATRARPGARASQLTLPGAGH